MIKILLLAANPTDKDQLRLEAENRDIENALRQADFRDKFLLEERSAVRVKDLQSLLLRHEPNIVHFSGHGNSKGEILVEDEDGKSNPISVQALSQLFAIFSRHIRCVVLNACSSEPQAKAIVENIDCVIGMSTGIGDIAATRFSVFFYQALGYGKDIKTAFDLGCSQINLENLDEENTPQLFTRDGIDPSNIFLLKNESPMQLPAPAPRAACLQSYLEAMIADSRPLRLAGLDERAGDPTTVRLSLEDIYVALNTRTTKPVLDKSKKLSGRVEDQVTELFRNSKENGPLSALEALAGSLERRMVLLGLPGTGKSTFVRFLALRMAQELRGEVRELENWTGKPILPVAISLGRFAETLSQDARQGTALMLENFLKFMLESDQRDAGFAAYILDVITEEGALVLFDGLDEVADLSLRPLVVQAVEAFTEKYAHHPDSRFLVTCRTYSYQDPRWQLTKWPVHELALLDPKQIEQFVSAWYDQHTLLDQSRANEYAEKRSKLLEALRPGDRRRLAEVAPFPIILTIMAIVHASYELPDSRAQVYKQCVELLLEKWQTKRSIQGRTQMRSLLADLDVPATRLYQALCEIAYDAHRGHEKNKTETGSLVTEKMVSGVIQENFQDESKLKIFLDYCQSANGLLMLQGTTTTVGADSGMPARRVYTFPHQTFEEYLAGLYLEKLGADHIRGLLDEAHDRWREVVKLLAEYLCFERSDRDRMNGLLEVLSSLDPQAPTERDWRAIWLAGELLLLYRRAIPKPSLLEGKIITNLHHLVKMVALSPRERAEAADILDQLWQPDDLYHFVPIQAAKTTFQLAKYPVTNSQYARFLEADDFHEEKYWTKFPQYAEPEEKYVEIGLWNNEGYQWLKQNWNERKKVIPRHWSDPRFGVNRKSAPVVGVSWYEANAYCKWLLQHWDELDEGKQGLPKPNMIRLPMENEWVMAAGGEADGHFAWGNLKDQKEIVCYANTSESGLNCTTPVWMYPQGESEPYKLMDMSGNVLEWQANFYDKSHSYFGLRGGSWSYNQVDACVKNRINFPPYSRDGSSGFRVLFRVSE